jgi:hypothetical protein
MTTFPKRSRERPMQTVPDVPMGGMTSRKRGRERYGEDVVAAGVELGRGVDPAHGGQPSKAVPAGGPAQVIDDRGEAGLDAAVIAVDRLRRLVEQGLRIIEQQFDVLEERSSAATTPSIRSANAAT